MKLRITVVLALWAGLCYAQEYQMKQAPLMTPWADEIDINQILPEYPRPQMKRDSWINLNGLWDLTMVNQEEDYKADRGYNQKILVPFPVESAISGVMDQGLGMKNGWYKRTIELPAEMQGQQILLHFGAVDWRCKVYVNGQLVGDHEGGYDPFSFNISEFLQDGASQLLEVSFYDPTTDGGQPVGKQSNHPEGIWYTPVSGIWQTVWLEAVPDQYITDYKTYSDIETGVVSVKVSAANINETSQVKIEVMDGESVVASKTGALSTIHELNVGNDKLWSPEHPHLFDLRLSLLESDQEVDQVAGYFGMRKIEVKKEGDHPRIFLNGEEIFQFGVLDQGWWPDGLYTAPSDEALKFDIEKTKEFGFNMSRKHVKVEPSRWYYHCDTLGMLVWQDIPNTHLNTSKQAWIESNFSREMVNIMKSLDKHPSIVQWSVFNEGWGQEDNRDFTSQFVSRAQQADTTRIITGASGWHDFELADIQDRHSYPAPGLHPNPTNERAAMCGEYGGIALTNPGHLWDTNSIYYVVVDSEEELSSLYLDYASRVEALYFDGMCAAVYTQITDLESEVNGLMTYDREVTKHDVASIRTKMEEIIALPKSGQKMSALLSDARRKTYQWKYTTAFQGGWQMEDFDDSGWNIGQAGFGAGDPPSTVTRTQWSTSDIYLRRSIYLGELTTEALDNLRLSLYYDEDCSVYINGVLAFQATGYTTDYQYVELSEEAKAAIRPNSENLIAVTCHQTEGGQYIDVGLVTIADQSFDYNEEDYILGVNTEHLGLTLYPNPAEDILQLTGVADGSYYRLYSISGQLRQAGLVDNQRIDLGALSAGIYVLKLQTGQQQVTAKVMVR